MPEPARPKLPCEKCRAIVSLRVRILHQWVCCKCGVDQVPLDLVVLSDEPDKK